MVTWGSPEFLIVVVAEANGIASDNTRLLRGPLDELLLTNEAQVGMLSGKICFISQLIDHTSCAEPSV